MKKCLLLFFATIALLGCKKNEITEEYIRGYYDVKLSADTAKARIDELQAKHDSLNAIADPTIATLEERVLVGGYLVEAIEHHTRLLKMQNQYSEWIDNAKGFFDRNYWKIYEKELREQGRIE